MGYVNRYRAEAQAKELPNWQRMVIVELRSGEAMALPWMLAGQRIRSPVDLPQTFPTYDLAFEFVETILKGA